ncbi:metal ion efflux outer membrane protein [Bordetella ansorpii]|uniref:Metal ion efflux outer membrane protein n=1 Tax=Bordetella ansorpii TaxID=288768 RepID=A0A157RQ23_9BORD|nr:metal ion efflux outer membrane protein [Bordetella ansorpii]SAI65457.1 metal ion efflux outer membrane protein [Bordetella ansorpii]
MRFKPLPLVVAALCLLAPPAWAQSGDSGASAVLQPSASVTGVLTLQQALDRALEDSPLLSAARNEAKAADGLLEQAGLIPNPSLDVSVEDQKKATRTTTTMLSVPIELGGKRGARTEAARLARDVARLDADASRAEVRASVMAAFFDVAVAQENVRVAGISLDVARQAQRIATQRVESGKAAPIERTRADVEVSNARLAERAARIALEDSRRTLVLSWGESTPGFEKVDADLDSLPARPSLDELRNSLNASPRMASSRTTVELSQAELEVERSKRFPDITLSAGVARDNEMGRNRGQVGVSIPLPLFDRNQGNVYAASMRAYKAQDVYRDMTARNTSELLQAASRYDLAVASAQEYRDAVLPGAAQAFDAARKGFEAGKMGYLEVLDAQRALSQGNVSYLNVLAEAYQARAQIDRIIGR